jgi:hypothetical protein
MNMKKLLTFLIALMTISALSFGQNGNVYTWKGGALTNNGDWQNPNNWIMGDKPYTGVTPFPVIQGTRFPGQAGATEDEVYFNSGTPGLFDATSDILVDNVPECTLGALEVTYNPGGFITKVRLNGASEGVILTLQTPTPARVTHYGPYWFTLKINEGCDLDMNNDFHTNTTFPPLPKFNPFFRIKLYAQPGAHVWQKNEASFEPSQYTDCDFQMGFYLQANRYQHAEFIQQELTIQKVKGWVEYWLDDSLYHYICPPITSEVLLTPDNTNPLDPIPSPEFSFKNCRVPNCLCLFDGDFVRKFDGLNTQNWDSWLGLVGGCFAPVVDIETGRGYEYVGNDGNPMHTDGKYRFYGHLNTGDGINGGPKNLLKLPSLNDADTGWNFIGNPFASAIQFGPPSGQNTAGPGWEWNSGDIDPVVYWWDNESPLNGAYRLYNWFTGLGNGPVLLERRTIPRSQGFFVHVVAQVTPAPFIRVGNEARFFRGEAQIGKTDVANHMMVTLKDQQEKFVDNAIVHFRADIEGTDFNHLMDAYKLAPIVEKSQIYFKTTDNVEAAMKTLKLEGGNIMVPLYLRVVNSGNYTLSASEFESFLPTAGIMLKDNKTNTTVDLKLNPVYAFEAAAGDDNARFSLYFSNVLNGINNPDNNAFKVYSYNSTIVIQSNDLNLTTGTVLIYDMIGKQVSQENLNSGITEIKTNLNMGFYIVSVKTNNGVFNQKVYIN